MLPKRLKNYTKFATKFLKMGLPPPVVNWKPSEICQGPQRRSPKGSLGPWQIYRRVPISYSIEKAATTIEKVLQRLAGHLGKFTEGFPNLQKDSNFLLNRKSLLAEGFQFPTQSKRFALEIFLKFCTVDFAASEAIREKKLSRVVYNGI